MVSDMTDRKLPDFTETTLSSTLIHEGSFLRLYLDRVRLPDGGTATREYVRHPGAAMMLPMLDDRTVILVRQFRYPVGMHFIEIPAGKLDPGEDALAAAKRELVEECGYEAAEWRRLATIHPCIGYSDEFLALFLARRLTHVGHAPDDEEFIEILPTPVERAFAWVREGRITEAKAVIGLMWLERLLSEGL
jgi:ADP-ribose pyrophosphatase